MTLHEFVESYLPIVQAVISIIGILGIYLLWLQIKQTNEWNRISTQHVLLSDLPGEELEKRFHAVYRKYCGEDKKIAKNKVKDIFNSVDDFTCVKSVLNKYEHLCGAICSGALDDDYAYAIHSSRITNTFIWCEHFIVFMREEHNDDEIYLELEKVASRWIVKSTQDSEKTKEQTKKLRQMRGTKKSVP